MQTGSAGGANGTAWWHFRHGADIGVAGRGATPAQAFEQAAWALVAVVTDPASVEHAERVDIECDAPALDLLLVDWLNALVFEMAARDLLFGAFSVQIESGHLTASAWGERVDRARHQPAVEVKGATYTELAVEQEPSGEWTARCVVDV